MGIFMSDRPSRTGGGHRAGRRAAVLLAVAAALALPARGVPADDPSAIVVIGGLHPEGALAVADDVVPGQWRLETLLPRAISAGESTDQLETLARHYRDADFLRCLTHVDQALDPDELLQHGRRDAAARAGTLAAACALGSGDEGRARDLLRQLAARELVEPHLLRGTTPAFQRVADEERQAAHRRGWVAVDVRSEPDGASIHVNGVKRCAAAPCRVHLLRGEHLLVAHKLGHRSRTLTPVLNGDHALTITLDPASADETRQQLATALGAGADPSAVEIPRAAASAFGVGLLVLVWVRDWQVHAAAYQAGSRSLTHVAVDGRGATTRAVAAALHGWRAAPGSQSEVRAARAPMFGLNQPIFWVVGVAVAFASFVPVFRLRRSKVRPGVAFR
jgi:hypothetical protein